MEKIKSLVNRFANGESKVQKLLSDVHVSLLRHLVSTTKIIGKNYKPGHMSLIHTVPSSPFSALTRIIVSRNAVDIFTRNSRYPGLTILRRWNGKYFLLDGLKFRACGEISHEHINMLPPAFRMYDKDLYVTIKRTS